MSLNKIRTSGFCIVYANSATRKFIHYCVVCRGLRSKLKGKKMAELRFDRHQQKPPIHILLGLFVSVSRYLRQTKRIKTLMFTCLFICAIHIELSNFVDTSFILLALQKCIGRSGDIWQIGSKNGSNQFEAVKKFPKPFQDMNCSRINEYLQVHGAD